jgi:4-amino-4-deoxy-L-arabinose transferase-like glycosyltransferase
VLAKGLVPLVLALPLAWMARRRLKDLLHPAAVAAFVVVAAPWYLLCWRANGWRFIDEFFLRHHFGRFSTEALQHQQPFWFYVPVLLAGLFPWTPLAAWLLRRRVYEDARRRFLLLWVLFGLAFFSASVNKLPGYLLPLMPGLCALLGLELAEARRARWLLAGCALLVAMIPAAGAMLPQALLEGLRRAEAAGIQWGAAAPAAAGALLAWWLETRGRRWGAVGAVAALMIAGVVWLKAAALPAVDRVASARSFWRENWRRGAEICVEEANRGWRYGLNYYAIDPLPECRENPRPWRLRQNAFGARLEGAD